MIDKKDDNKKGRKGKKILDINAEIFIGFIRNFSNDLTLHRSD